MLNGDDASNIANSTKRYVVVNDQVRDSMCSPSIDIEDGVMSLDEVLSSACFDQVESDGDIKQGGRNNALVDVSTRDLIEDDDLISKFGCTDKREGCSS